MKTEFLLQEQVNLILAALTPVNRLVMRTMLHTGLRVGDVLELRPEQIKPRFWITEQKTGKRRFVGLTEELRRDLLANAGKYYVFPHRTDPKKHHTRQAVWKDLKRAAAAFRLPQNVGTHSARKCYAVDLLWKYGDIEKVRRALNHSRTEVTMLYALADAQFAAKYRRPKRRKGG